MFPVELDEQRGAVVRGVTGPAALADLMNLAATVHHLRDEVHELRQQLAVATALLGKQPEPSHQLAHDDRALGLERNRAMVTHAVKPAVQ